MMVRSKLSTILLSMILSCLEARPIDACPRINQFEPTWSDVGMLCFQRYEDNGHFNAIPVSVFIGDNGTSVTLGSGGLSTCVYLPPAEYKVILKWSWNPAEPPTTEHSALSIDAHVFQRRLTQYDICMVASPSGLPKWQIVGSGVCPVTR
jgi:hypothetical protein